MLSNQPELTAYRLLIADVLELAAQSRRTSEALAAELGQTAARWHLLSVLSDGPRTASSAARRLGLTRQSLQRVVHEAAAAGLVVLEDDPRDARAPLVRLTDGGRSTLDQLVRRSDGDRSELLQSAAVSLDQLRSAGEVVRRLLLALRAQPAPPGAPEGLPEDRSQPFP